MMRWVKYRVLAHTDYSVVLRNKCGCRLVMYRSEFWPDIDLHTVQVGSSIWVLVSEHSESRVISVVKPLKDSGYLDKKPTLWVTV